MILLWTFSSHLALAQTKRESRTDLATGPLIPKCYVHVENTVGEEVLQKGKTGCIFFPIY